MRTILKLLVVLAAALLGGVAQAGEAADAAARKANNEQMAKLMAKALPADVLEGRPKRGHVYRYDIVVNRAGEGRILALTAVRPEAWQDGLGRPSVQLERREDKEKNSFLVVKLSTPAAKKGGDERWALEDRVISSETIPVKFEWEGKMYETLPETFIRRAEHTVRTLPNDHWAWVSAGALRFDRYTGLLPKEESVYGDAFSDRFGGAALIRYGREGLEFYSDADSGKTKARVVTLGYLVGEPQPEGDPQVFDRTAFVEVKWFVEDRARSRLLASRLSRRRGLKPSGGWAGEPGDRFYFSQRYLFLSLTAKGEYRFRAAPGMLVADAPFEDEYGPSNGFVLGNYDAKREVAGQDDPPPDRIWVWPLREERPDPTEVNAPALQPVANK